MPAASATASCTIAERFLQLQIRFSHATAMDEVMAALATKAL
jgi:hypothetical protein